jgi:hypothetical protein
MIRQCVASALFTVPVASVGVRDRGLHSVISVRHSIISVRPERIHPTIRLLFSARQRVAYPCRNAGRGAGAAGSSPPMTRSNLEWLRADSDRDSDGRIRLRVTPSHSESLRVTTNHYESLRVTPTEAAAARHDPSRQIPGRIARHTALAPARPDGRAGARGREPVTTNDNE